MSYIQEADCWLEERLREFAANADLEALKRAIRGKLLESYRNGQRDCPKCNPRKGRRLTNPA